MWWKCLYRLCESDTRMSGNIPRTLMRYFVFPISVPIFVDLFRSVIGMNFFFNDVFRQNDVFWISSVDALPSN